MDINRMAYIVYFRGGNLLKRIDRLPINVAYVSKKMSYLVFYGDLNQEKSYLNQMKNIKGFLKIEQSKAYDKDLNYSVDNN